MSAEEEARVEKLRVETRLLEAQLVRLQERNRAIAGRKRAWVVPLVTRLFQATVAGMVLAGAFFFLFGPVIDARRAVADREGKLAQVQSQIEAEQNRRLQQENEKRTHALEAKEAELTQVREENDARETELLARQTELVEENIAFVERLAAVASTLERMADVSDDESLRAELQGLSGSLRSDAEPAILSAGSMGQSTQEPIRSTADAVVAHRGDRLDLHFIDVGAGDATLIRCPNGASILVDAGSLAGGRPSDVRQYLEDHAGGRIDTLVLTHPDANHYNLLPYVIADLEIGRVVMVGGFDEYRSPTYVSSSGDRIPGGMRYWLEAFEPSRVTVLDGTGVSAPDAASDLFGSGDVDVFILAADEQESSLSPANSRSIVLKVSYGAFDAILPADATLYTERAVLDRFAEAWLDVEVLKLGSSGSDVRSNSVEWLETVRPETVVVSAALESLHGHPRESLRPRLEVHAGPASPHSMRWWWTRDKPVDIPEYARAIFSTATNGTIVVRSDGTGFEVLYGG